MSLAFEGLTLAALLPVVFVAYCRSLVVKASKTELSAELLKAILAESASVSAEDFQWLQALVGLCPIDKKDRVPLAAVWTYFFLLTFLRAISSRICTVAARHIDRERQRCSHFVAVRLDQRIANARRLRAEQMIHPEK